MFRRVMLLIFVLSLASGLLTGCGTNAKRSPGIPRCVADVQAWVDDRLAFEGQITGMPI